jgi:hypothetical protein
MSFGTFAMFSKFHLNTSKYPTTKIVQFVEGHNFHVDWHFKFREEIGEKLGQPPVPTVYQNRATFKVGKPFLQKTLEKNTCEPL